MSASCDSHDRMVCLVPSAAQASLSPNISSRGDMVGVKRRTKDTILQATGRKSSRTSGSGSVRIEIPRSSITLVEIRGGLASFLFTGPAFKKFLETIRQDAPALLDRETRCVSTQWRVPLLSWQIVHLRRCCLFACEIVDVPRHITMPCRGKPMLRQLTGLGRPPLRTF